MNQKRKEEGASRANEEAVRRQQSLAEKAVALIAKAHELKNPLVVDRKVVQDPESGMTLYQFRVVNVADANGPAYPVILNEQGETVEISSKTEALFNSTVLTTASIGLTASPIRIQPDTNTITLNPGDIIDETIIVTIPKNAGPAKADVYGAPGGMPGQATRIAASTGGVFATGINAGNIVNTIITSVTGAVSAIQNVNLMPSASVAPFITSITPPGGYGPLAADQDHTLKFNVKFNGIPCKPEVQVITGTIDVVADGTLVASKKVQITVPACRLKSFIYSIKFICGVQPECSCECTSVRPGKYATEINLHNYASKEVVISKRFIPLILAGAPLGREPRIASVRAEDKITLPPHTATMDDCCRIGELLFGDTPLSPTPLTIGFLEITSTEELSVTAVYTASDTASGAVSIDVEQIKAAHVKQR